MSFLSKFFSQKAQSEKQSERRGLQFHPQNLPATSSSLLRDGVYRSGAVIDKRYEVAKALAGGMGIVYFCVD